MPKPLEQWRDGELLVARAYDCPEWGDEGVAGVLVFRYGLTRYEVVMIDRVHDREVLAQPFASLRAVARYLSGAARDEWKAKRVVEERIDAIVDRAGVVRVRETN